MGAYGNLLVPHKRGGQFVFDRQPYLISVSFESPKIKTPYHLLNLTKGDRQIVEEWLEFLDIPLGEWHYDEEGKPVEETKGIVTHHTHRRVANLLFFEESRKQIELKPFQSTRPKGFGFLQ